MNLLDHLVRQIAFSAKTFGPGSRLGGVADHIRKELVELSAPPSDLEQALLDNWDARYPEEVLKIVRDRCMKRGSVATPGQPEEWVDVVLLALDGFWRSIADWSELNMETATPEEIRTVAALAVRLIDAKQTKNEGRDWPDWRTMSSDKAIEHDRSGE